jgi:hypothetical protein
MRRDRSQKWLSLQRAYPLGVFIMDSRAIRDVLHGQPFKPFTLRLADGRTLHVPHPDYVAVANRTVVVISPVDESLSILEPLLIVSIEVPGGSPKAESGQGAA